MNKTYVLDTNILLHSPTALFSFSDNTIVLTEAVLEELDNFKKGNDEINCNARSVSRYLEELRLKGNLIEGIPMDNGGTLKISYNQGDDVSLSDSWSDEKFDNKILKVCKSLQQGGENVFLVTKDINLRLKGDLIGIPCEDYETEMSPNLIEQYTGREILYVYSSVIDNLYRKQIELFTDIEFYNEDGSLVEDLEIVYNKYFILKAIDGTGKSIICKTSVDKRYIKTLDYIDIKPFDVIAKNSGQNFMKEALMDDDIPLVIIKGAAGTAKTFMSLACGLQKVIEDRQYRKILVCRPNILMDEDLGALPGTEQEKIGPLMRPIKDNLEVLLGDKNDDERELTDKVAEVFDRHYIETEAVGYLRGRSIYKQYIIIDEAQNLTPKQIKGIITRVGEGTKLVICGDPQQIDNPYINSRTNGLSYASECMKDSPYCAQITLDSNECVRSRLAEDAANRL